MGDEYLKRLLDKLYLECEHGDEEHRQWLKDKFESFYLNNQTKLVTIEIPNFSEYIKKANKARELPYIKGKCRLPKMYDNDDYEWRKIKYWGKHVEVIVRKSDGLQMISNKLTANKPRLVKVNGQDIYNQRNNSFGRAFVSNTLHTYYKEYLKEVNPFEDLNNFPLCIELMFYIHDEGKSNIDNDNKWVWEKGFQDTLTELGIIPDDNCYVINRNEKETVLIPNDQEPKLVINIYGPERES